MSKKRALISGCLGNILDHYDNAIFGFLVPFIAPYFFPNFSTITALILTYSMLSLGLISRPIGSLFFGYIGDTLGRKKALFITILGMSITTFSIGLIPTYNKIGFFAPLLLATGKIIQGFFSSGETPGGAIFVLENCEENKKNFFSSLYQTSSILGIFLASLAISMFSSLKLIENYWRYLFFIAAITAFLAFFIRIKTEEPKEFTLNRSNKKEKPLKTIFQNISIITPLLFIIGFSYSLYITAIILFNSYLPLITNITLTSSMNLNTHLLFFDIICLPLFGILMQKFKKEKMMISSILSMIIFTPFLFFNLKNGSLFQIIMIRTFFILIGASFSASIHSVIQEKIHPKMRYQIVALSFAIGSQAIGKPTAFISLWILKKTGLILSFYFYLLPISILALFSIYKLSKKEKIEYKTI
ncbi:MAG: hypothetical protein AMS24_00460 [Chlamydiae bacterium SM23_39]|nr:MAG: hypothetical protein AMS24_00460 [Chlamydiae bacterium SM23_39]